MHQTRSSECIGGHPEKRMQFRPDRMRRVLQNNAKQSIVFQLVAQIHLPHSAGWLNAVRELSAYERNIHMHGDDKDANVIFRVVMNHEEQYSIWPEYREIPLGWKDVGKSGSKEECLSYIKEVWTDMRPLSLRKQMMT